MSEQKINTFKGFDKNLQCRGYQFEIGGTYKHEGRVEACGSGFHACESPLDVFGYYPPADSRFAETISSGETDREEGGDTKIASASITIKAELTLPSFIQRGIEWIWNGVDKSLEQQVMTGHRSAATNTGHQSAATNTGHQSAATNTGDQSAATNTGHRSAATNTGDQSAATNTGDRSSSEIKESENSERQHSVAAALGLESKARAPLGSAIVCVFRNNDGDLIHIKASKVGENGIEPNVWYTLDEAGEFVQVED